MNEIELSKLSDSTKCWHCGKLLQRKHPASSRKIEYWYAILTFPTGERVRVHKGCLKDAEHELWPQKP